jgi:hypothetical protein
MARWHQTRERLYDDFASNLAFHELENKGLFKCPICLDLFTKEHLISKPGQNSLALAHIVPKSFLNAGYTLCCINCDSKFGSTLAGAERVLRHNLRLAKWNNQPYSTRTTFNTDGGPLTLLAELSWSKNGEPVPNFRAHDIPEGICSQALIRQSDNFFTRNQNGAPDDLTLWKSYLYDRKIRYANLNWWHSLYLFMFHHFAYQWTLDDSRGKLIRHQLNNLDEEIIPDMFLEPRVYPLIAPYEAPPHDRLPQRPSLRFGIDSSGEIITSGYYVIFPKLHESMDNITLFLPWDFTTCKERPDPVRFTARLKYGHSVIKHQIPDYILPQHALHYCPEDMSLCSCLQTA